MINRTCEDLKPLLAATGSHFDTGVGPWQLSNRRFDEISEMVKPHSERVQISTSAPGIISDLCSRILMGYEWPQKAPSGDDAHSPSSWLRHHKSNEPNLSREFVVLNKPTNTGWWFQPFWKLWKSMGRMTSRKKKFETTNQNKPIVPIDSGRFSRFVGLKATAIWKWANRKVLKVLSFQEVWKKTYCTFLKYPWKWTFQMIKETDYSMSCIELQ